MGFLRVVEVFPPLFADTCIRERFAPGKALDRVVKSVSDIGRYSDLVLVADIKNPELLKLSSVYVALAIKERAGVEAAPVVVVRDSNRAHLRSAILTAVTSGLNSIMLAWGDRYLTDAHASNVYDYAELAEFVAEASTIGRRAGKNLRILAPVTLTTLSSEKGITRARSRLDAGAELLLAQPPTTDSRETFERHLSLLESSGLKSRVLLNIFPFRSGRDVRECERYFGWKLPRRLHETARSGKQALLAEARSVSDKLLEAGLPGVYVSTRGIPALARTILKRSPAGRKR